MDDAIDGSFADAEVALPEFLSDDFRAGFGIQEPMADDLTDEFLGAPIVGFGPSSGIEKGVAAFFQKESSELEVPLSAKSEFGGGSVNSLGAALALNEHSQFSGYLIGFGNGKGARFAFKGFFGKLKGNHRILLSLS